ncbi:RNA methyltransferase PUA domain-containing protein, partial [Ornithinicoccus halotolerans]|uniref:RNA methyltransferase PUA domain-containing protein n=1 Tax=Ornithinicoccus halotolerans TaxID=1748220 RepID=UPI001885AE62
MSAPLFLLGPGDLDEASAGAELVLDGPEGRHAADVLRLAADEPVLLSDGSGVLVHGRVVAAARGRLDVEVDRVEWRPAPEPRLVLVQALAKGDRDLLAVEAGVRMTVIPEGRVCQEMLALYQADG